MSDIKKLFENAVLVRDMDYDSISNAYFVFSSEPKRIEEIVRQAREDWNNGGSDCLFCCIEEALNNANVKYTIVSLANGIKQIWV